MLYMEHNRVTIADVAQAAGVSTQTVSRVINGKSELSPGTRAHVLSVIERLGYRPSSIARGLATSRTHTLGLVVPDIANPFFPELARGAEDAAREHGYGVFVCNTGERPDQEAAALDLLHDRRVDGIIVSSSRLPDDRLHPLLARGRAAVLVNRPAPPAIASTVRVDDADGTRQAVAHLLARGRRSLALINGPATSYSAGERARGFAAALETAGIVARPELQVRCQPDHTGGFAAVHALLAAQPQIDALVCYNDLVAVGALQACAALERRVPDDVAVIGCDDILLAALVTPALTTVRVDKRALGAAALDLLLARIAGRVDHAARVLAPTLIVRASA
jgi:LacI family transcriptional regulator